MTRASRIVITLSVAGLLYCCVFTFADIAHWPALKYYPVERQWGFSAGSDPRLTLGMGLYGRTIYAFAAGLASGIAAWFLAGRGQSDQSEAQTRLPVIFLFFIAAFVISAAYFVISLSFNNPKPVPIPDWYSLR